MSNSTSHHQQSALSLHTRGGSGLRAELPYLPDMPMWQYLKEIVLPSLELPRPERYFDGLTLLVDVFHVGGGQRVRFDYEGRLRRLGDCIEPGSALVANCFSGDRARLRGNAAPRDRDEPCPICIVEGSGANFAVEPCGHAFHAQCLLKTFQLGGGGLLCPLCRGPLSQAEQDRLGVRAIEDVYAGDDGGAQGGGAAGAVVDLTGED